MHTASHSRICVPLHKGSTSKRPRGVAQAAFDQQHMQDTSYVKSLMFTPHIQTKAGLHSASGHPPQSIPATVCESGMKCSWAVPYTLCGMGRCRAYSSSAAARSQMKSKGAVPPATIQAPSGLTQKVRQAGWLLPGIAGSSFFSRVRLVASHSQKLSSCSIHSLMS